MKRFDIVTQLIALAGRIQAKRVERLKRREVALKAAIDAATRGLVETQRQRKAAESRTIGE